MALLSPGVFVALPDTKPVKGGLLAVAEVRDEPRTGFGIRADDRDGGFPHQAATLCWSEIENEVTEKSFDGISALGADPFGLYAGVECFMGPESDFEERAQRKLELGESVALERIFLKSYLETAPTTIGTGPYTVERGIALLEQYMGATYNGQATFHMDRFIAHCVLDDDGDLETPQGSLIANGAGYGLAIPAGASAYIYATGQVTVFRSPIETGIAHQMSENRSMALAERVYAIVAEGPVVRVAVETGLT